MLLFVLRYRDDGGLTTMGRASQFTTITGPRAKESSSFSKSSECRNRTPKVPDLPHRPRASSSRILASKTNFLSSRGDLVYRCSGLISVMCAIWVYSMARLDVLRHQRSARPLETCRDSLLFIPRCSWCFRCGSCFCRASACEADTSNSFRSNLGCAVSQQTSS